MEILVTHFDQKVRWHVLFINPVLTLVAKKSPYSFRLISMAIAPSAFRNFLIDSRDFLANCLAPGVIGSLHLPLNSHQTSAIKAMLLYSDRRYDRRIMQVRPGKVRGFSHSNQP